jgi:RND family efflux transporter MFP subunit
VAVPAGSPGAAKPGAPPPGVTVSKPLAREIVEWDEYVARFDAVDVVEMRARISGYLTDVHFKDGQHVRKGDPLFTIDPRPFERALDQAKAELAQARTKVENSSKDVERGRPLLDRKILSEKVFDDRENLKRDAEAAVRVADAKVKTAELDLSFTRIAAPITGRISRAIIGPGNWVSAGGSSNATLLTSIVTQDPIHIYFDVSENNLIKYKRLRQQGTSGSGAEVGGAVQIALPDETGFPHTGKLDFSDNRLDPGTGTLRARALVDNKDGLFSPGMFARLRIAGSARNMTLLLPDEAIGTDQINKFVYVVAEDGTASRKAVTLGPLHEGLRVVRAGLTADDWVVIRGIQRARPGQKVTPKREPLQLSAAPAEADAVKKQ